MSSKVPNIIIILYSSLVGKTGKIFPLDKTALAIKEACFIHNMMFYVIITLNFSETFCESVCHVLNL